MKPHQINVLSFTVLRDFEQIDDAQEARLSRQHWSDVLKTDLVDRIHDNLTFVDTVAVAHFDMWACPYADAASDFSPADAVAKPLGEYHNQSRPFEVMVEEAGFIALVIRHYAAELKICL